MSGFIKPRFRGIDRKKISDEAHIADYSSSPTIGRVTVGSLCLYYRDLGKKYYVPYEAIEKVYSKIVLCAEDEFANNHQYYKVILQKDEKDIACIILATEEEAKKLYEALREKNPAITFGQAMYSKQ